MAIDYGLVRVVVNELNRSAIRLVDMVTVLESGAVSGEPLTEAQITGLETRLKTEADGLKTLAGEIKTLISE